MHSLISLLYQCMSFKRDAIAVPTHKTEMKKRQTRFLTKMLKQVNRYIDKIGIRKSYNISELNVNFLEFMI